MSYKMLFLAVLVALLGCGFLSCDGDDEETPNPGSCQRDDGDTESANFTGYVQDLQSKQAVGGLTVIPLDNVTGDPIEGMETTSAADGKVQFEGLPAGRVGFKVLGVKKGTDSWDKLDTYQFNIRSNGTDEVLWSVGFVTYRVVLTATGIDADTEKAIAAGGAYWLDSACAEFPIGCGTVDIESGEGDVRYSKLSALPTSIENQDKLHPSTGRWVAANLTPGPVTAIAKVGDKEVGRTTFRAYAGMAISIGNIETDPEFTTNPGTCK